MAEGHRVGFAQASREQQTFTGHRADSGVRVFLPEVHTVRASCL